MKNPTEFHGHLGKTRITCKDLGIFVRGRGFRPFCQKTALTCFLSGGPIVYQWFFFCTQVNLLIFSCTKVSFRKKSSFENCIGVGPITQVRTCVIKILTFKRGHLCEQILSCKRSSHFEKERN